MKILGSDYDGTLTRNDVTDEKLSAIEKWRSLGNKFGIVTGHGGWCSKGCNRDF